MSTGLHAAREDLHLPHVNSAPSYMHNDGNAHGMLPKPLSLSPRTFGMEDLRDFCGPLGSFKTGLTPRVFSTGLTPRSGFTPRFTTGFTPRINTNGLSGPDTNSFFNRNTGFSPPRQSDVVSKISPTGFTPKDISGMKVPMRFPGTFAATPQKMEPQHHQQQQQHQHQQHQHQQQQQQQHQQQHQQQPPQQMNQSMQHKQMLAPPPQQQQQHHMHHMAPPQQSHHQQQQQHAEMNHMNMMYDYMHHRPTIPQQAMMPMKVQKSVSPMSEDGDPEDLDERRRMKNRERVRKCRKRKQDRLNFLEDRTAELEQENGHLKAKLARKTVGAKEPLTEAQVKELRKKQNTTLSAYVRVYNENADPAGAKMVWAQNAEIIYGNSGTSVAGIDPIIANKAASASVFSQYKIKNYNVQWKESSQEKCLVNWEIEAVVKQGAPKDVPLTAPFADLAAHYAPDEVITVHAISHLTFDEGKIVEEIRQLNLAQMAESVLTKFAADAGKSSEILRCLMKA